MKVGLALTVAVGITLIAGCGGGGSSSDNFVADADGICKKADAQQKAVAQPTKTSQVGPYLDKVEPILTDGISQLSGLTPPSDQKDTYDKWVANLKQQETQFKAAQATAKSDPSKAVTMLQGQKTLSDQGNALAKQLGLKECGKNTASGSSGSSGSS
jgi:hypothetical protein